MPDVEPLYLPHALARRRWWQAYVRLSAALSEEPVQPSRVARAYARLTRSLVSERSASLAAAIARALVGDEQPANPHHLEHAGAKRLLIRDVGTLTRAASRDLDAEAAATGVAVPGSSELAPPPADAGVHELARTLAGGDPEAVLEAYLNTLRRTGGGPAALSPALRWRENRLQAVEHPDAADWSELVGLDEQLGMLAANTEALLQGDPAHDVLLYGARGSGKSTAVRGLLGRFGGSGLRLVEVQVGELTGLPELLDTLRGKPQTFVVYVDDLAFDDGDPAYRPLKTLLEGALSARPANVALYATSNRRHLLKERFADRPAAGDDDVHGWDTQHERLALADRFGLTLTFPDATQRRYLEVVRALAARYGLDGRELGEAAIRFAEWGNGYSGRTARQFVDGLRQRAGVSA